MGNANTANSKSSISKDIANIARETYVKIAAEMLGQVGKHVSEIHSSPRVTTYAHSINLERGFSLDLLTNDPYDGKPWDFRIKSIRERALKRIKYEKKYYW